MFGVDFSELVVIFAVALVVLGPTRMPGLVRQIGRWVGKARGMARQFREQLESEIDLDNLASTTKHSTPAPTPELSGAPVANTEPATEPAENYPYGSYPYAEPPAAAPAPAPAPQPGDDTYSHAHASGDAPMPYNPPEAEDVRAASPHHPAGQPKDSGAA